MEPTARPLGHWTTLPDVMAYIRTRLDAHQLGTYLRAAPTDEELVVILANVSEATSLARCMESWNGFLRGLLAALWYTRANGGDALKVISLACPVCTIRLEFQVARGELGIGPPPPSTGSRTFGRIDTYLCSIDHPPQLVLSPGTPRKGLSS